MNINQNFVKLNMTLNIPPIITNRAFDRIAEISDNQFLRISVQGGGCSGFKYEIALDDKMSENDIVYEKKGSKLIIDDVSLKFLGGATIDYTEELIGARFTIDNPNASSSCGCGISFNI